MTTRSSLIRLASKLPQGSEERRAILSGLEKLAGNVLIGSMTAYPGMDTTYGESLEVFLNESNFDIEFVVKSWAREGGMDSFGGAGPREVIDRKIIPASKLKSLATEIKNFRSRFMLLKDAPLKSFRWLPRWSRRIEGLSSVILLKVIDSYTMDKDVWERTWNKPVEKPTGGPFTFGPGTTSQDVATALTAQGFPATVVRGWTGEMIVLGTTRAIKTIIKLMTASASTVKVSKNDDGHSVFDFNFSGWRLIISRMRMRTGGYNWALQTKTEGDRAVGRGWRMEDGS